MAGTEWTPGGPRFHGKLGKLQYRSIRGKDIVSPAPDMSQVAWSQAQQHHRQEFKESAQWGRAILADRAVRATYEARARELDMPLYALIYRDWRRGPHVEEIALNGYCGRAGQEIQVRVDDPLEAFQVDLWIRDTSGTLLETGAASRSDLEQVHWTYRTTLDLASPCGLLIEVVARDRRGNCDSRVQLLAPFPP